MAKKQSIGEVVASSMRDIMESEEHQEMFGKTAAKKKCCPCETKCTRKCPCKTDGGCKKSCSPCAELAKKASEKKCCDCEGKCADNCPCKDSCSDCNSCGDGKMSAEALVDMMHELIAMSEEQEAAGLFAAADQSLKAASVLEAELRALAFNPQPDPPGDENEISSLDAFEDEDEFSLENDLFSDEETPKTDEALKSLMDSHPDFAAQFKRRVQESEPVGTEGVSIDDILGPTPLSETVMPDFPPPPSGNMDLSVPGAGRMPPSEKELTDAVEEDLASGNNPYFMYEEFRSAPTARPGRESSMSDEELDAEIEAARAELAGKYKNKENSPELFSDEELDEALKSASGLVNLIEKFAFEADEDFEDDGIDLEEVFPEDAHSVDAMMDQILEGGADLGFALDFESDDEGELAFAAKDMVEPISHWYNGQGDVLYRLMSAFNSGSTPDLEDVVESRDKVESLFNNELEKDVLDMDSANELHKIHTFLVDYLEAKGYPEPGQYLDADPDTDEDGDSLMDAYMSILSGPEPTEHEMN